MASTEGNAPPPPGDFTNVQHIVVVGDPLFGPYPKAMKCPHCGQQVTTVIKKKNGLLAYGLCAALCILGCFLGCCLIPLCIDATQDVEHVCPHCKKPLGSYRRCG